MNMKASKHSHDAGIDVHRRLKFQRGRKNRKSRLKRKRVSRATRGLRGMKSLLHTKMFQN
jgi:hypothetical protein